VAYSEDVRGICDIYQRFLNREIRIEDVLLENRIQEPLHEEEKKVRTDKKRSENTPQKKLVEDSYEATFCWTGTPENRKVEEPVGGSEQIDHALQEVEWQGKIGKFLGTYTVMFLVTFLLAYSPFLLERKSFIWIVDGRSQHYPALAYIGRYLRGIMINLAHGNLSIPMFDLNIGVGADVVGSLNYYGFGDPLYLLAAFVPTAYIEYLYDFLAIFRMYLAGLTFSSLCRYHRKDVPFTLIGALMYAFSGYAVYQAVRHPLFINPMIQLPLLLMGIDMVMKKKRPILFVLSVFYSALCGFYFLYMMTLVLAVYVIVKFFDYVKTNRFWNFVRIAKRIVGNYLLGTGMAALLLLPTVCAFFSSSRAGASVERNYLSYGWDYYHDHLLRIVAPAASEARFSLAAIVLFAVILLFFHRKGRRDLKLMLIVGMVVYLLPVGGYVMNGFAYPSQRWTFAMALLLSYVTVEMLPELLTLNEKQRKLCLGTCLLYGVAIFTESKSRTVYYVVGFAMLLLTLLTLLLCGERVKNIKAGEKEARWITVVCVLLIVGNVSVNAVYRFAEDQSNYIGEFSDLGTETERIETAIEREAEKLPCKDEGRFDSLPFNRNVSAIWHVPTIPIYWSIINKNIVELWKNTENTAQRVTFDIQGADQRIGMSTLLSTKYFLTNEKNEQYIPYGYEILKTTEQGNKIYQNRYALPWGYTYENVTTYASLEGKNGLEQEETMLQCLALDETLAAQPQGSVKSDAIAIAYSVGELSNVEWTNGILKVNKAGGTITLEQEFPAGTTAYVRFQGLNINDSGVASFYFTVKTGDVSKSAYAASSLYDQYSGRENYLLNLGYSDEVRTNCTITFPTKGTYKLDDIQLYAQPMDNYVRCVEALREEPLENIEWGTNKLSGTVDLSKNKVLCVSIPYSSGWTARVDGEKAEILRGNYMFMALPLETGHHEIEFTYCTPGLKAGLVCCVVSVGILACYIIREKRRREC